MRSPKVIGTAGRPPARLCKEADHTSRRFGGACREASTSGRSMMRALDILPALPLVLAAPALAQNAQQQPTSPNSGAGIAGQPGSKNGPAAKSPSATTGSGVGESRNQDAAKVPGLPGSKSGPAVKSPSSSAPTPK